jgi:hypothetical protein
MLSDEHFGQTPMQQFLNTPERNQRISTATLARAMVPMTREMLEPHIQQTPGVKGVWNYIPVAETKGNMRVNGTADGVVGQKFVGWRQKLNTW